MGYAYCNVGYGVVYMMYGKAVFFFCRHYLTVMQVLANAFVRNLKSSQVLMCTVLC